MFQVSSKIDECFEGDLWVFQGSFKGISKGISICMSSTNIPCPRSSSKPLTTAWCSGRCKTENESKEVIRDQLLSCSVDDLS